MRLCSALAVASLAVAFGRLPPDTSLASLPVAYYGANWNRSQSNIDTLSRLQYVVLMQEDGECWTRCCPDRLTNPRGQCGVIPGGNSSNLPGCGPECDQIGQQLAMFGRIKGAAAAANRRAPHTVLYANAVYLWPFDASNSLGREVQVLDVHGQPHMENCDPGIFPSYFWDFSREAGRQAWLDVFRRALNSTADGAYIDCQSTIPLTCHNDTCIAKRNGKLRSVNEQVTPEQVQEYTAGKLATLQEASALMESAGATWYPKGDNIAHAPQWGGNVVWLKLDAPPQLQNAINNSLQWYDYVVVGGSNSFSDPRRIPENLTANAERMCSEDAVAQYLLAIPPASTKKGALLLCNGWLPEFDLPLGSPPHPATESNGVWTRTFPSGTVATWDTASGKGTVTWGHKN